MTITLYDLPSTIPEKAFAPNPYKIRYALAYKGIPFQTTWVEFPHLPGALKALGASPTTVYADGSAKYTTPTIVDRGTGKVVTESIVIAEYLDETYPDRPVLFPPGAAAAIYAFDLVWHEQVVPQLRMLMIPMGYLRINPESKQFYLEMREKTFNCKFEDIMPVEKRPVQFEKLKASLSKIAGYWDKNGKDKLFFLGETFSYADCIVGGYLIWAKKILDPHEWMIIAGFDDGRWARLVEHCETFPGSV